MKYTDCLKPLYSKPKVYKIASYDIETLPRQDNKFLQGGFIDAKGKYKSFWNRDKMIEYMLKHTDKDTMIFATNNKFDYSKLFIGKPEFLKKNPLLRGSRIIYSEYQHMKFYDTLSFTKASVKELGKMLGKYKGSWNIKKNKNKMTRHEKTNLVKYNRRDCEITREFMLQFQEFINMLGGELKITIGSTAMNLFRRRFQKNIIYHEKCKHKKFRDGTTFTQFLFKGYHGGRTEMFKRGYSRQKLYYYDFNSCYSAAMIKEYPNPNSCYMQESDKGTLSAETIMKYEGVSEVDIIIPYMYYPPLPVYVNDKLCFPVGLIEHQVFTNIELREAIRQGAKIIKIYKQVYYTQTFKPFKEFVNVLYSYKEKYTIEKNVVYRAIIKLILNNLYGKFGQHHLTNTEFMNIDEQDDNDINQEGFLFDEVAGFGFRETPIERELCFVIPIFAIYTTAYARLALYEKILECSPYYCDTDSVMTTMKMPSSEKLGDMKLEGEFDELNIFAPKHYMIKKDNEKPIYHTKGLQLSNDDIDRNKEFDASISGKPIRQKHFIGIKESVRRSIPVDKVIFITKKFDSKDNKRVWIKPYSKKELNDSSPIILGVKNIYELKRLYDEH